MARSHANRGKALERRLELQHARYAEAHRALVFRTPPSVKMVGPVQRGGRFLACFEGEGPPDYAGVIAGGRAVLVEAKTCEGKRWALSLLHDHQARALQRCHELGGVALVVLAYAPTRRAFALPWATLGPRWWRWKRGEAKRGEASLALADLVELGVSLRGVDWLAAVRTTRSASCTIPHSRVSVQEEHDGA